MDGGSIMSRLSTSDLCDENDEKVKSDFDDAREQPNSLNPIPITIKIPYPTLPYFTLLFLLSLSKLKSQLRIKPLFYHWFVY